MSHFLSFQNYNYRILVIPLMYASQEFVIETLAKPYLVFRSPNASDDLAGQIAGTMQGPAVNQAHVISG